MDQELKQRLIGAAVVTALAAIFIPMLFDDPIDDNGKMVSELTIPPEPVAGINDTANKLPASAAEVTGAPDIATSTPDPKNPGLEPSLQTVGNNEQVESLAEETGQWADEGGTDEEPAPIDEDTGNDLPESVPEKTSGLAESSKLDATPIQPKSAAEKPAKTRITEQTPKPVKSVVPEKSQEKPVSKPIVATKVDTDKAKSSLSRWYIQAGSFSKKENALSRWEALHKQGLPVLLETLETDKGPLYRLKVGPELVKKRAFEIRDRLNKQNIKTIVVAE